jgi:hypothetical protein
MMYNPFGCAIIYSVGLLAGVTRMTDLLEIFLFLTKQ